MSRGTGSPAQRTSVLLRDLLAPCMTAQGCIGHDLLHVCISSVLLKGMLDRQPLESPPLNDLGTPCVISVSMCAVATGLQTLLAQG